MESITNMVAELDQIIASAKEILKIRKKTFTSGYKSIGISDKFITFLETADPDYLVSLDLNGVEQMLNDHGCDIMELKRAFYNDTTGNYESYFDFLNKMIEKLQDNIFDIEDMEEKIMKYTQQKDDIVNNFVEKINSPEYKAARIESLEMLKGDYESLPDTPEYADEKRNLKKRIDAIESSRTFMFLLERFTPKGWKKEKQRIMDGYFSTESGSYTMFKFKEKMRKLAYDPRIYRVFLNIEEKLLPEIYWPLNNLFLYSVMRYISHIDINNEKETLNASAILNALLGAARDEIDPEQKEALINVMKRFNEYFMDETEYFKEHNNMYKFHPSRVMLEKAMEKEKEKLAALEAGEPEVETVGSETEGDTEEVETNGAN